MTTKIEKAIELARTEYGDKKRVSGETIFEHAQNVYNLLVDAGVTSDTVLLSALFHGFNLKDTRLVQKVETGFGKEIIEFLKEYKEYIKNDFKFDSEKDIKDQLIIESALKLANDKNILILRLADKTESIKTSIYLSTEERKKAAKRSLYFYAPLAKLIGLNQYAEILADNSFRILFPREYFLISSHIDTVSKKYSDKLTDIRLFIKELLEDENMNFNIEFRIKSKYSFFRKLTKKLQYKNTLEEDDLKNVKDIFALRIILDSEENCYKVEDILKSIFNFVPSSRDDYIAKPKVSGYQSIHNDVLIDNEFLVEIQIRTFDMHEQNEFGAASHFFYKFKDFDLVKYIKTDTDWLRSVDYMQQKSEKDINIYNDSIFAFTPQGDIIKLPKGSTAVDFAYAIHDHIGNHYKGAIVNGKIVNYKYELKDGDKVEILTDKKLTANLDWLEYVKSFKAKKEIRRALRKTQKLKV